MNIIVILMPVALALGLIGLGAFFWCMRTGQFSDMEGAGWRVLRDDDLSARPCAGGGAGESSDEQARKAAQARPTPRLEH